MISHRYRVIFVHVPKTAGTSVESVLGHHGDGGAQWGMQDHRTLRQVQWPHGGAAQLASIDNAREAARALKSRVRRDPYPPNRLTVDRAQYARYLKFAVVRDPWARAYSWYRNVLADEGHRARLGMREDSPGLADFLERYAGTDLDRPQTYWLIDFSGRIGVDAVCRFESLASDFADVCRRAGLPDLALPHLNRSTDSAHLDRYDDRARRIVAERHRAEIEHFGYIFGDG